MSEPYNDLKQIDLSIQSAQRIIGQATMSMDHDQLLAKDALQTAKQQYDAVLQSSTIDDPFLERAKALLQQCEQQINEALK